MNQIFTHPGQPQMQVEVILASRSTVPEAPLIHSVRMRYPRPIHGEIMTHRKFSRNARSSRAVPVLTMLNEVRTTPYVPWHWGANQKGMQASEECNEPVVWHTPAGGVWRKSTRELAWLEARDKAVEIAEAFMNAGYHKQNANRLMEPFSWMDCLITSTDWDNFLWLRDHKDAEPHLQDLARLVKQAIAEADVQTLKPGEWHTPYIVQADVAYFQENYNAPSMIQDFADHLGAESLRKISVARCARISIKPFDGDASYEKELERYNSLVTSDRVHASPLEHAAMPDVKSGDAWASPQLHGNLRGWIQFRKTIPNEFVYG